MRANVASFLLLAACGHADAEASADAAADVRGGADALAEAEAGPCGPDAAGFSPPGYVATNVVRGACSADDAHGFAAACAPDPNDRGCSMWLAAHATCAHCLLGDSRPGPFRKSTRAFLEISPGTCGQALADETYDASADANVGGCGEALERAAACVAYACEECDDSEACRADAYRGTCVALVPALAACDRNDAGACVLGSVEARAEAIAWAVCGGSP